MSDEGYKKISKVLMIPRRTVKSVVKNWKVHGTTHSPSKSRLPSKSDNQKRRPVVREGTRKQMTTLKDSMENRGKYVHSTTISTLLAVLEIGKKKKIHIEDPTTN